MHYIYPEQDARRAHGAASLWPNLCGLATVSLASQVTIDKDDEKQQNRRFSTSGSSYSVSTFAVDKCIQTDEKHFLEKKFSRFVH